MVRFLARWEACRRQACPISGDDPNYTGQRLRRSERGPCCTFHSQQQADAGVLGVRGRRSDIGEP